MYDLNLKIVTKKLANGLTVISVPQFRVPLVSIQLWYGVGSKHEKSGEKGIAHLIEHMIFKGTERLSESDINLIAHKLSGNCNAFTSHDYTGYLFNVPAQNWSTILPIMADCMSNCTFKEELLRSELKAVIQELKMYRDDYGSTLFEKLLGVIFQDHPYHYPIIGYKQDLWGLKRESLVNFYKHHYIPNNATLVTVGAVSSEEVFEEAERSFGAIQHNPEYHRVQSYHCSDISAKTVTLQRDINQPLTMLAWVVPGSVTLQGPVFDCMSLIIGSGKGSRLFHKIVDDLKLATNLESFYYDLVDYGLFIIHFQPSELKNTRQIIDLINQELDLIAAEGFSTGELERARRKAEMDIISIVEDQEQLAYSLGKYFNATGDPFYFEKSFKNIRQPDLGAQIQQSVKTYLRPAVMHSGSIVPLAEAEKMWWIKEQERSDEEDARVLEKTHRSSGVEAGFHVHLIEPAKHVRFDVPIPEIFSLSNGLKVFCYHNADLPKLDLILDIKATHRQDPDGLEGVNWFAMNMLDEGSKNYFGKLFTQTLESHGMHLDCGPGRISLNMRSSDLPQGLSLMHEMLVNASFEHEAIEKLRNQIYADIDDFWDSPSSFIDQIARETVYGDHPHRKPRLGDRSSVQRITRNDLLEAYKNSFTPCGAALAVVGDVSAHDVKKLLEESISQWTGSKIADQAYPKLSKTFYQEKNYFINRDQVVLAFAGLSTSRLHNDFEKLFLFDQILTGGVSGTMSSRLFQLREQSGLFYTIGGSLVRHADQEPGMIFIKTIVSHDRLKEAEQSIDNVLNSAADSLTEHELTDAKRSIVHGIAQNFATNYQLGQSYLFLHKYGFSVKFFDEYADRIMSYQLDDIKETVKRYLSSESLSRLRVGRLKDGVPVKR